MSEPELGGENVLLREPLPSLTLCDNIEVKRERVVAVAEVEARRSWPAPIELCFGPPLLTVKQARNWRYFALGVAVLVMLVGWLADPYYFAGTYGLLSIVGYLLTGAVLTALTVLPTVRRASLIAWPSESAPAAETAHPAPTAASTSVVGSSAAACCSGSPWGLPAAPAASAAPAAIR